MTVGGKVRAVSLLIMRLFCAVAVFCFNISKCFHPPTFVCIFNLSGKKKKKKFCLAEVEKVDALIKKKKK